MTLKEYLDTTNFGKKDKIGLRDHAGNILVDVTTRSKLPKKYYKMTIRKGFLHEDYWGGEPLPKLHELWLETIDHEMIEHRERVANAFCNFLYSFGEDYKPEDVAIICRRLLEERTDGFDGNSVVYSSLCFRYSLPKDDGIRWREEG